MDVKEEVATTSEESITSIVAFTNKLLSYGEELGKVMLDKAPEAYEALLDLIRFKSAFVLAENLILFLVVLGFTLFMWTTGIPFAKKVDNDKEDDGFYTVLMGYLPAILLTGLCTIIFFSGVLDFQTIIGIVYPEGYLALKAINSVGITI